MLVFNSTRAYQYSWRGIYDPCTDVEKLICCEHELRSCFKGFAHGFLRSIVSELFTRRPSWPEYLCWAVLIWNLEQCLDEEHGIVQI